MLLEIYTSLKASTILYNMLTKAIKFGAVSNYLHYFQSTFFHGLQPFKWKARICHLSGKYKQQPARYNPPLTDFNPRLSLLWIAMASSSCRISDSSVVTRSRTSGVLTKRTNLKRVDVRMTQQAMPEVTVPAPL